MIWICTGTLGSFESSLYGDHVLSHQSTSAAGSCLCPRQIGDATGQHGIQHETTHDLTCHDSVYMIHDSLHFLYMIVYMMSSCHDSLSKDWRITVYHSPLILMHLMMMQDLSPKSALRSRELFQFESPCGEDFRDTRDTRKPRPKTAALCRGKSTAEPSLFGDARDARDARDTRDATRAAKTTRSESEHGRRCSERTRWTQWDGPRVQLDKDVPLDEMMLSPCRTLRSRALAALAWQISCSTGQQGRIVKSLAFVRESSSSASSSVGSLIASHTNSSIVFQNLL